MNDKGFTLLELMVVIGIMSVLSAVLLLYNRTGEKQIILSREQARLTSVLFQARSLSLNSFGAEIRGGDVQICGYGVNFSPPQTFTIFQDRLAGGTNCAASNKIFDGGEEVSVQTLDSAIKITSNFSNILFMPPEPTVVIDGDSGREQSIVAVSFIDGSNPRQIIVNKYGQISPQ